MPLARPVAVFAAAALLMIAAFAPAAAAWPADPAVNTPVCTASGDQWGPVSVSDGLGGSIVAWYDWRSGNADVYVQRFDATGNARWTAGGVLVCGAAGDQTDVRIVTDNSSGAIVVWQDGRGTAPKVLAQRISSAGVPLWAANGVGMGMVQIAMAQTHPAIASTGSGTCVIAWEQSNDIVAQRLTSSGATSWASSPVTVCNATGVQQTPVAVYDATAGNTGAFFVWRDDRNGNSDLYAQRFTLTGTAQWIANGTSVCTATGDQMNVVAYWERTLGVVMAWMDHRAGNWDIYALRLASDGSFVWGTTGVAVCTAALDQWYPRILTGGTGKTIVGWVDWRTGGADVYAQSLSSAGAVQWVANGVALCTRTGNQTDASFAIDGSGGVVGVWQDYRNGVQFDLYAQRLNSSGVAQWATDGVVVSSAVGDQTTPFAQQLTGGGLFAYWMDQRGVSRDIYAQALDGYGIMGAAPVIVSVRDVPNDQGSHVVLRFDASARDAFPYDEVSVYRIWSRAPGAASYSLVDSVQAAELPGYSRVMWTTRDSSAASNVRTSFRVDAYSVSSGRTWASEVDSGYSVDDLSPPPPAAPQGVYSAGVTTLTWLASDAPDVAGYNVYREYPDGALQLSGSCTTLEFTDAPGMPLHYRVGAVDTHGNESARVRVIPTGAADGESPHAPPALALSRAEPNPARGTTALRLSLPRAGEVHLAVYDQQGRLVRELAAGRFPQGVHRFEWDGHDASGHEMSSGVYFVRARVPGASLSSRVTRVR